MSATKSSAAVVSLAVSVTLLAVTLWAYVITDVWTSAMVAIEVAELIAEDQILRRLHHDDRAGEEDPARSS
jgi:hypothetical protein